jgi:hypothetical protein
MPQDVEDAAPIVFREVTLCPPADVYVVPFNGGETVMLRITHPRHGEIDFCFTGFGAVTLAEKLSRGAMTCLPAVSDARN